MAKQTKQMKGYVMKLRNFMNEQNLTFWQVCRAIGYTQYRSFENVLKGNANFSSNTTERLNTLMRDIHKDFYRTESGQLRKK